ncbi:hypothetical protein M405DRAFT_835468 [Rhizopogon salebrosus TDB-379]|nr:hypothetical protein M405DRAFT_835468 [Rhizopogon salebrosus TDB-379]
MVRALSRDEDMFPNASLFDPSRHLTTDGQLTDPLVNHPAFGRWFAGNAVWTAIATILSVLRMDNARDPDGHKLGITPEFSPGPTTTRPKPFICSFEIVNTVREEQLRAAVADLK